MPTSRPKGLRPFTARPTDIQVADVFSGTAAGEGGTHFTTGMGLLGNGKWGDCYWAAAARTGRTFSKRSGRNRNFDEPHTLTTYEGYLGKKLSQQTDEGTDAREGAKYLVEHGILDANGKPDPISAYAFEGDPHAVPALIDALGSVIVCIELTEGNEEEFNTAEQAGEQFVWDLSNGSQIAGGHAIPATFWTPDGLGVNSWDREGIITWDYLAKYMQTTVIYFSAAILDKDGTAPDGLDREKLEALVAEVTS